jgi:hypothetical protein
MVSAGAILAITGDVSMGIEEAVYTVEREDGGFEVRQYAPQVVAEVLVDGTLDEAGDKGFGPLFAYISGANRSTTKIAMTAPVAQQPAGEKIPMTAPVSQQAAGGRWAVSFVMPSRYTLETLPDPTDKRVRLRLVPSRRMASVRYSGTWSRKGYERNLARLRAWLQANGLTVAGEPVWARYNPPFTPWFMRRNEVLLPIDPAP